MSKDTLANFILLPELKLKRIVKEGRAIARYECEKEARVEYCPRCAEPSQSSYDSRRVRIKDAPIRGHGVVLQIRKRRLWCKPCQRPFTEPVPGIRKGKRHTERYQQAVTWACANFADLKAVRRAYRCSAHFLYHAHYSRLERKVIEKINYPWPALVGIDEHSFKKDPITRRMQYASMIVDYCNKRVREVVLGKSCQELTNALATIPGRENVLHAVIDLCEPFRKFIYDFFPNATITADKFHVLRLLSPALLRRRKQITGTRADARAKRLLLMSGKKLDKASQTAIWDFLNHYPELNELYWTKEVLHRFYRTRGYNRACAAFTEITDDLALSELPEIKTLRKTLLRWREEILNYFKTGLTNARTEGFNNKAKVVKRRGYGYKSFRNYRLKVLTACV